MPQHDYDLANAAGAAFRTDLNAALAAIVSENSGATAPATTFAYMYWADTTSGWLKQRNAANSAWIKVAPLAGGSRVDVASAATLDLDANAVTSDYLRITGTTGVTAITLADGQRRFALANGAFQLTHGASLILPGSANYTCTAGDLLLFLGESGGVVRVMIWKGNGTPVVGGSSSLITTGTPDATTSGTSREFTGLSSTIKRLVIWGKGVSTNGTSLYLVQIGPSGGVETSGYSGNSTGLNSVGAGLGTAFRTDGISLLSTSAPAAADLHDFVIDLTLVDPATNTWAWTISSLMQANRSQWGQGNKALAGALARVKLTTVSGGDTFDAGTWNWVAFS